MDLKRLYEIANHPYYKKDEVCPQLLDYPLDMSAAPREEVVNMGGYTSVFVTLPKHAAGVPRQCLYRHGPFWCSTSPESHVGPFKHAIDFLVPEGTEVLAACDGKITTIKEDSKLWGPSPDFREHLNYVDIRWPWRHAQYYAQYCHLGYGSVSEYGLKVGSQVKRGQPIARTGKSGWMDRDHLHFLVWKQVADGLEGFVSLKLQFPGPVML